VTILASVATDLGRIYLHGDEHGFDTRRRYMSLTDGRLHEGRIHESRESALRWYELCSRDGAVYTSFPDTPQPEAASERTTA
jgi:hypothetical protein